MTKSSNTLYSYKQFFLISFVMGISFITDKNSKTRTKYLDDDGTGVKPKHFISKTGKKQNFGYNSRRKMLDRDPKKTIDNYARKIKSTGYIYLHGSQYCEAEDYLKLSSCIKDAVINYIPNIDKFINKLELYNQ